MDNKWPSVTRVPRAVDRRSLRAASPPAAWTVQAKRLPATPPVYRPSSTPPINGGLSAHQHPPILQSKRAVPVPPVYRPQTRTGIGPPPTASSRATSAFTSDHRAIMRRVATPPGAVAPRASAPSREDARLHRQCAAIGLRVRAGSTAPRPLGARGHSASAGVAQAKMGMELELPVVITKDNYEIVPSKETIMVGIHYKIEGDRSSNYGKTVVPSDIVVSEEQRERPTIVEVVTHPIDEHLHNADTLLNDQLNSIDHLVAVIKAQTKSGPTTASRVARELGLVVTPGYENALIGVPTTGGKRQLMDDSANVHFTVGIAYSALTAGFLWMKEGAAGESVASAAETKARKVMSEIAPSITSDPSFTKLAQSDRNAVLGYLRLALSNIMAIEAYELNKKAGEKRVHGGVPKNYTLALSRTPFNSVWASMPPEAKTYLHPAGKPEYDLMEPIKVGIVTRLETEAAMKYAAEIFTRQAGTQASYFGGMQELRAEEVGPADQRVQGIPVELRHLGKDGGRMSSTDWRKSAVELLDKSRTWHGSTNPATTHPHPPLTLPQDTLARLKEGLPIGWTVAVSPEGKPYYYHEQTKKSQWDKPVAVESRPLPTPTTSRPAIAVPEKKPQPSSSVATVRPSIVSSPVKPVLGPSTTVAPVKQAPLKPSPVKEATPKPAPKQQPTLQSPKPKTSPPPQSTAGSRPFNYAATNELAEVFKRKGL